MGLPLLRMVLLASIGLTKAQDELGFIPPVLVEQARQEEVFEPNEIWRLICRATGNPSPYYSWKRNNEIMETTTDDGRITQIENAGTIVFTPPLESDQAYYQCFATNTQGTAASHKILFRKAVLLNFPVQQPKVVNVQWGNSLRLPCNNAPSSYPLPVIMWGYKGDHEHMQYLDITRRVSVDLDGGLNFASVEKKDELLMAGTGGLRRTYYCSVYNSRMLRFVHGEPTQLNVQGTTDTNYEMKQLWTSPSQRTFIEKEKMKLMCMYGGKPTPELKWSKVSGDEKLDASRTTYDSYGLELIIFPVIPEDAGSYECRAQSGDRAISKSFVVTVESKPSWTAKPESVTTEQGQDVEVECSGRGIPTPTVHWFINGEPLASAPENPRRKLKGNVLKFSNIIATDAQVVQCNVTNQHGYLWGQAYLNVLEEAPSFIRRPASDHVVAVGQATFLRCEAFGAPAPVVVWTKEADDMELTGGRYVVNKTGLLIQNVQPPDQGSYRCTASNKYGSITAMGHLSVTKPTVIRTAPEDLRISKKMAAKFVCTAVTDPEKYRDLVISWLKDGFAIDPTKAQRFYTNVLDSSLNIAETEPEDTGTYTCQASNGIDAVRSSAQLVVEDIPEKGKITNVECDVTNLHAYVYWQLGGENSAPILEIKVEYRSNHNNDRWYDALDPSSNFTIGSLQNSFRVDLRPGSTFDFRVTARNRIGWSLPSDASKQKCKMESASPPYNPKNVRGWGDRPNNMIIQWIQMQPIEHYGGGFHYLVRWREKGRAQWEKPMTISDWRVHWHIVNILPTFTEYEIQVEAQNEHLQASEGVETEVGFSGESAPVEVVAGFAVNDVKHSSARFTWNPPDTSQAVTRGLFLGFRIEYWNVTEGEERGKRFKNVEVYPELFAKWGIMRKPWHNQEANLGQVGQIPSDEPRDEARLRREIPDPREYAQVDEKITEVGRQRRQTVTEQPEEDKMITEVILDKLPSNCQIAARIRILNLGYMGTASPEITFTTPEGPPGPVRLLTVVVRTSTTITIKWTPPDQPGGRITGYELRYRKVFGLTLDAEHPFKPGQLGPEVERVTVTGLESTQNYRFYVYAITSAGMGPAYFLDAETLTPAPPGAPSFVITDVTDISFNVTWWAPAVSENPGSVFYVEYRVKGTSTWQRTPEVAEQTYASLTELSRGEDYEVRVVAAGSESGLATAAEIQEVNLLGLAARAVKVGSQAWFIVLLLLLLLLVGVAAGAVYLRRRNKDRIYTRDDDVDVRQPMTSQEADDIPRPGQKGAREYINPYGESLAQPGNSHRTDSTLPPASASDLPSEAPPLPAKKGTSGSLATRSSGSLAPSARGTLRGSREQLDPRHTSGSRPDLSGSRSMHDSRSTVNAAPRYAIQQPAAFNPYAPPPPYAGSQERLDDPPPRPLGPRYATRSSGNLVGDSPMHPGGDAYPVYEPKKGLPTYQPPSSRPSDYPTYGPSTPPRPAQRPSLSSASSAAPPLLPRSLHGSRSGSQGSLRNVVDLQWRAPDSEDQSDSFV